MNSVDPITSITQQLATAAAPLAQTPAQNRELIKAVKAVNAAELFGQNSELTFALDRDTRRPVVRIVDRNTGETIEQIPPEYLLRLAADIGPKQQE